jgi:CRISPR-associated protein Csy1
LGKLSEYIQEQAKKKNKTPEVWLEGVLANLSKCTLATHVGKFSNPDSKVVIYDKSIDNTHRGLVMTSSAVHKVDLGQSAKFVASGTLLVTEMEDSRTCLEHLQAGESDVYREIGEFGVTPEQVNEALDSIAVIEPCKTSGRLRQVYFPVGQGKYHLLTVVPASSLLETMKKVINDMEKNWSNTKDKKKDTYGKPAAHLSDLTMIGFGGTKPQNISALNMKAGGKSFLLPSLPPVIRQSNIRLPEQDFFRECVPYSTFSDIIRSLHKLFIIDRNNLRIRKAINNCLENAADCCISTAELIRIVPSGWSQDEKYERLPMPQKIWLDNKYKGERYTDSWEKEIGQQFGRWLIRQYMRIEGNKKVPLGNEELQMFSEVMENSLRKEVNMPL